MCLCLDLGCTDCSFRLLFINLLSIFMSLFKSQGRIHDWKRSFTPSCKFQTIHESHQLTGRQFWSLQFSLRACFWTVDMQKHAVWTCRTCALQRKHRKHEPLSHRVTLFLIIIIISIIMSSCYVWIWCCRVYHVYDLFVSGWGRLHFETLKWL